MLHKNSAYWLNVTIPVLIAVISVFIVSDLASGSEFTNGIIASIDESREDVLKLAASSTAVSVAVTALPGDLATPVAENLADLSSGFLIVLCALYLEKFLVSVTGMVAFQWLVPIACLVYIAGFLGERQSLRRLSFKLVSFALAIFLIIPTGIGISNFIQEKYGEAIQQTIESAESCAGLMEESVEGDGADEDAGKGLGEVLKSLQQAGDTIARGTSQLMKYLEKLVSRFIEAIAIMIVTSCIIPLLAAFGFVWVGKIIFTRDLNEKIDH